MNSDTLSSGTVWLPVVIVASVPISRALTSRGRPKAFASHSSQSSTSLVASLPTDRMSRAMSLPLRPPPTHPRGA